MSTYLNLTEHEVVVYGENGRIAIFPTSGIVVRVGMIRTRVATLTEHAQDADTVIDYTVEIPVIREEPTIIYRIPASADDGNPMPPPRDGVRYIVSRLVLQLLPPERTDCVAPDTGQGAVRDAEGRIIGTRGWIVLR